MELTTSRDCFNYRQRLTQENALAAKWNQQYGRALGLDSKGEKSAQDTATLETATVAIVIIGGALSLGEEPSASLVTVHPS